jgi:hypothetical protein
MAMAQAAASNVPMVRGVIATVTTTAQKLAAAPAHPVVVLVPMEMARRVGIAPLNAMATVVRRPLKERTTTMTAVLHAAIVAMTITLKKILP